jgi:hypothetical protein
MQFVVIRLGKDSKANIHDLDKADAASLPMSFDFVCTQVEEGIEAGDIAFIWFGSDNSQGTPTTWKQGLRAIGVIDSLARGKGFNDQSTIALTIHAILPESVDQYDLLENAATFFKYFSKYPVIGLKSSRNNAIQKVHDSDPRRNTSALLTSIVGLFPQVRDQLAAGLPGLLPLLTFSPVSPLGSGSHAAKVDLKHDPVWQWISHEIFHKGERNFLFLGAPGTGKTWYAHEIAAQLTGSGAARQAYVQFHPSLSYDDFVEGYTPRLGKSSSIVEYTVESKHFLLLCEAARGDGGNLYVIVIDELSRGDPSRVFGDLLTYIEGSYRDKPFSLSYSRRSAHIPDNVVIIATANPYDRSVGELDDALLRRFVMREFPPSPELLKSHLTAEKVDAGLVARLLHVFGLINSRLPNGFGHAHFWKIRTEEDFRTLWTSRVEFLVKRALMFEDEALTQLRQEIEAVFPSPAVSVEPEDDAKPVEEADAAEEAS